jgi:queuine tRNA-ribosyltransferase
MQRYPNFSFEITDQDSSSKARLGKLTTPHGTIDTPAFIFCATKAAIKGATMPQMKEAKTQIILSNTYHLMLQPGPDVVKKMGGLHKFIGWDGPMLTDSGGYQVFSLGHGSVSEEIKGKRQGAKRRTLSKITEEGATFHSYIDGKKHLLTPERSIQVQHALGPDLVVMFDECTPYNVPKSYTEKSLHLSHRWGKRSLDEFDRLSNETQALYGIIQGGVYEDLRKIGTDFVNEHDFFGHAVGGSLGATKEQMEDVVSYTMELLNPVRPIHLLGIGGVRDIFHGVRCGIDTFDCVHPTRLARHGGALVKAKHFEEEVFKNREHMNLRNAVYREDDRPIDASCECHTCQTYSRAYLHHLIKADELLYINALTVHNVFYMNELLADIRKGIATRTLDTIEKKWLPSR